jgi:hypothetical protein
MLASYLKFVPRERKNIFRLCLRFVAHMEYSTPMPQKSGDTQTPADGCGSWSEGKAMPVWSGTPSVTALLGSVSDQAIVPNPGGSLKIKLWRFALYGADDSQRVTGRETVKSER